MFKELKEFLFKGNVLDLAVAVVFGGAFGAIVTSLVNDIIMPLIGAIFGQPDFSAITLGPILIGNFLNAVVNFLIVGCSLFVFVKAAEKALPKKAEEPEPEPEPDPQIVLLEEIRDAIKNK
jgi:large conductance mechanosensitive channel